MEAVPVKISVVVPVYQVEKYLSGCLDTVLKQSFVDFELILVDDGSSDHSGEICDAYARKDARIRVIHQENCGVTAARRRGVDEADGEYICFVDADDTLPYNALADLLEFTGKNQLDIGMGGLLWLNADGVESKRFFYREGVYSGKIFLQDLLNGSFGGPCGTLYRKVWFDQTLLTEPREINRGEDMLMKIALASRVARVGGLSRIVYHYLQREDSVVHRFQNKFAYTKNYCTYLSELLKKSGCYDEFERDLVRYELRALRHVLVDRFDPKDEWLQRLKKLVKGRKIPLRERIILMLATNCFWRRLLLILHHYQVKDRFMKVYKKIN